MSLRINLVYGIWNTFVVLIVSYVAIMIPLEMIFNIETEHYSIDEFIVTFVFFVDLVVNVYKYREIKRSPGYTESERRIWYLKVLILTDLLAAIPFGMFFHPYIFRFFRLFKLFRIIDLFRTYRRKKIKSAGVFTFFVFICWIILFIHWIGCGWVSMRNFEPGLDTLTVYINSIYWTITTLTTVGYGDILPVNNVQKLYSMVVQLIGFGVFGFLIGTIASTIMKKDPAKAKYDQHIDGLASLMHYRTIPTQLRKRIVDFYTYMWKRRLGYDETAFLESLPENLQTEVALQLKKDAIKKISLFKNTSNEFKREIALLLKPIFLTPGDYIFKAGDYGEEMYFIVNGELNVLTHKEDKLLATLKTGDFFGEIALFKNKSRTATIQAKTYCDIYVLDKKAFKRVLTKYPEIGIKIEAQVEIRESR